jgi:predicted SprT family Zn-dependent metalloprotease
MTEVQKFVEVLRLGNALMREHGLIEQSWKFELDSGKQRIGCCHHATKTISYSKHYIPLTDMEEIKDTILHEIAHALVGPNEGHGWAWKAMCIQIGARPERLDYESVRSKEASKPNYVIRCPNCEWKVHRFRMRRRNFGARCPRCHTVVEIFRLKRKVEK